jgi:hypothetical protein
MNIISLKKIQMTKKDLWLRLKNYHFDHIVPPNFLENITALFGGADASTKAFADKITRKHNWKSGFALRAINEYKKFVYLGIVSEFYVTPSKVIDVVWHEHLLFSKAYREFCTTVIEYEFDHYPELIPYAEQTGTFQAQYEETMELYFVEFGVVAPIDIWEESKFNKYEFIEDTSSKKKSSTSLNKHTTYHDSSTLHSYFDVTSIQFDASEFPEFNGGDIGGAGATGEWGADSDSGDGGSDGGGGCSGGCGGGD